MDRFGEARQKQWLRWLAWSFLALLVWAACADYCSAQEPAGASAAEKFPVGEFLWNIIKFDSEKVIKILERPEFQLAGFLALNLIVFVETGLLIGFCLPGDSLLVTAGIVCYSAEWNLPLLLLTLCLSAIVGDTIGYAIGYHTGPKIFNRPKSFFFKRDHLLAAQRFYEKHGGKTIVLARFVPIIRTFAPVVAGAGKMQYRQFLLFNVFGGIGWVVSMILIGYYLVPIFEQFFDVKKHVEKVIIIVVLLSIAPGIFVWVKGKLKRKPAPELTMAETSK